MENFTSPAARSPYGGMKDGTQQIGLTIVIKIIISKQSRALAGSIPARVVASEKNWTRNRKDGE